MAAASNGRVPDRAGRVVGGAALLALGVNGIVGVGVFFAPAELARIVPARTLVFLVIATGLALAPVAATFATLGARFDEDGGPVVFARAAFGEMTGFAIGWLAYVSAIFSASAVVAGLTRAVWPVFASIHPFGVRLVALLVATGLALACAGGMRLSAAMWSTLTVLKVIPLIALVGLAAFATTVGTGPAVVAPTAHASVALSENAEWSASSMLRAALTMTFLFQGFEVVPVVAGRARNASRSVPIAIMGSLFLAGVLYVALFAAVVHGLPALASSSAPLADAALAYGGTGWSRLLAAATSLSALGIALGMFVTTPHYLAALAPKTAIGRVGLRGVPVRALAATWILVCAVVLLGDLAELFTLSSLAVVLQYAVVSAALVRLSTRRRTTVGDRGARTYERVARGWAALGAVSFILSAVLAWAATPFERVVASAFLVLGYFLYRVTRARDVTVRAA